MHNELRRKSKGLRKAPEWVPGLSCIRISPGLSVGFPRVLFSSSVAIFNSNCFLFCDSLISFYFLYFFFLFFCCCCSVATCRKPLGKISLGAPNKPLESFVHCGGIFLSVFFLVFFSFFAAFISILILTFYARRVARSIRDVPGFASLRYPRTASPWCLSTRLHYMPNPCLLHSSTLCISFLRRRQGGWEGYKYSGPWPLKHSKPMA